MSTTTTWTQGNKLPRHKHLVHFTGGTLQESEHFASQPHRNDTDAHTREQSWTIPNWAPNGDHRAVPGFDRAAMLEEARNIHDAALYNQPYTPAYALAQAPSPAGTVSPTQPTPGQDPAPRVTAPTDITPLLKRLDDVENVALLVMEQGTKVEQLAVDVGLQANAASRLADDALSTARNAATSTNAAAARMRDKLDDYDATIAQIEAKVEATRRVEYVIRNPATDATHSHTLPSRHKQFDLLLALATALSPLDRNIWIAGPAGSGKTTAARQLAQVLNLPFDVSPSVLMGYELVGFTDGNGLYHDTAFRRMYENGGVWLGDECDGSSAAATIMLNGALANSHAGFPDKQVPRHPDFIAVAAANTWGHGGDANYVGRNKLDAAFLDRFVTLTWPYDEYLEAAAVGVSPGEHARTSPATSIYADYDVAATVAAWVNAVQLVRHAAEEHKATMVISPRASIKGAQLLRARITPALVVEAIFGRYRTHSSWPAVGRAAEDFIKRATASTSTSTSTSTNGLAIKLDDKGKQALASIAETGKRLQAVDFSDVKVFDRSSRDSNNWRSR